MLKHTAAMFLGKLEPVPPDLNRCDEGTLRCGQEVGEERGYSTVEPSDAATAQNPPSLRVARPRTSGSLRSLTDATASLFGPRLPAAACSGDAAGSNQVERALVIFSCPIWNWE